MKDLENRIKPFLEELKNDTLIEISIDEIEKFKQRFETLNENDQKLFLECLENSLKLPGAIFITNENLPTPLYEILIDELPKIEDSYKESYLNIVHGIRVGYLGTGMDIAKKFPEMIKEIPQNKRTEFVKQCEECVNDMVKKEGIDDDRFKYVS